MIFFIRRSDATFKPRMRARRGARVLRVTHKLIHMAALSASEDHLKINDLREES
jgi:hypothetical protein